MVEAAHLQWCQLVQTGGGETDHSDPLSESCSLGGYVAKYVGYRERHNPCCSPRQQVPARKSGESRSSMGSDCSFVKSR